MVTSVAQPVCYVVRPLLCISPWNSSIYKRVIAIKMYQLPLSVTFTPDSALGVRQPVLISALDSVSVAIGS